MQQSVFRKKTNWIRTITPSEGEMQFTTQISQRVYTYPELNGTVFGGAADAFRESSLWKEHESVRGQTAPVSTPQDVLVVHYAQNQLPGAVVRIARERGYRVATRTELIGFDEQDKLPHYRSIVALGSLTMREGQPYVALRDRSEESEYLDIAPITPSGFGPSVCFLLIRIRP